MALTGIRLP